MDFKELAEAARTCRRFEEDKPLSMADLFYSGGTGRDLPKTVHPDPLGRSA